MSNQIRLKRASGSDPSASDLVLGEPAVRTDTGEIFLKKDDGSIAKVAGGIDDGDKGDITVSNDGATFTIDNDAVTYAKIQNVSATNRILGRDSSGAGVIEEITPANLRTMINVENGATADQSASEILTLLKTVDGSGSGLDADTLDGVQASGLVAVGGDTMTGNLTSTASSTSGLLGAAYSTNYFGLKTSSQTLSSEYMIISANTATYISASSGHPVYIRYGANDSTNQLVVGSGNDALTWRGNKVFHAGNDGAGSGLDADTLDGASASQFVRSDADDTLNGQYTISDSANEKLVLAGSNSPLIRFQEGTTNKAYIQWNNGGYLELGNQESNELLRLASGSNGLAFVEGGSERTVYHTGNLSVGDGGLTQNNFTNADHSKLNGIESGATADQSASEIVALIADQTIAPSTIDMEDGEKIKLGASDDLEIFHGSNISTIEDSYGDLRIKSDLIRIQRQAGGENYLMMTEGGSVQVFHDGTERFRTGSGGNITFGTDAGGSDHRGRLYFKTESGTVRALFDPLAQKFQHYDNTYATFGNNHDLKIFHNGSHSRIHDSGTGKLQLGSGTEVEILNGSFNESMAKFIPNGSVELYEDNTKRFETSSYGSITTGVHSVSNGILELKAAIATSHTITTDYNALAVDPTINNGITVTVPSGAVWAIV